MNLCTENFQRTPNRHNREEKGDPRARVKGKKPRGTSLARTRVHACLGEARGRDTRADSTPRVPRGSVSAVKLFIYACRGERNSGVEKMRGALARREGRARSSEGSFTSRSTKQCREMACVIESGVMERVFCNV